MIVTIIGSMKNTIAMDSIKKHFEDLGCKVNSPNDPDLQRLPLLEIQKTWIEKIKEADLVVAISKNMSLTDNGESEFIVKMGESTSYEMATAYQFNKKIVFV